MKKDNFKNQILKFDPTHAPVEQVREWLYSIIDAELEKDEGIRDYNLIEECSDCEECLQDNTDLLSEEEYEKRIQSIISKSQIYATQQQSSSHPKKKKKKTIIRAISILAATFVAILLSITIIAASQGYTVHDFITENIKKIINLLPGEKIEANGITLTKYGESMKFTNMAEAIQSTGLEIMYPSALPAGVKIEEVIILKDEFTDISIICNTPNLQITIKEHPNSNPEEWKNATQYQVNETIYYIIPSGNSFQATAICDGYQYNMVYNNYDDLLMIIEGMKGIEP